MKIKIGIKELCANAEELIETITVDDVMIIDIRDIRDVIS